MNPDLTQLPKDGRWYSWTDDLGGYWREATDDPSVDQYCWSVGRIFRDLATVVTVV